ncbi:hypothetical protein PSHT_01700 [Puccinia striiformis]|uniref:Uncharacterized protein n=1 Tax=Puccinia striiformis TaxID=27350 RepID=A0A2S4WK40_9BASI|nr:hypothetical protein PSHT_01700 [Puccinia striiformis]
MKFKEQNKQINEQRNEIINLRQANTSFLNAQSQWNRVVDELEHIKVVLNEVLSLLRKPDYAASAGISTGVVVFPIDNKPKNEEKLLPPKDIDSCQSSYRTPSQSTSQGQLRLMDVLEAGRGKFLLDLGASTHVCGNLHQFITQQQLDHPKVIALVVADCTINVTFKGSIRIPTPTGTI